MSFSSGEIIFVGKGNPEPAKFTIIPKDLAISKEGLGDIGAFMEQFLHNEFGLQKPKVLLSVTGGAQDFNMLSSKLEQVFSRGLIRAAQNTTAWIITGGLDAGVMKFVGEAIRERDISDVPVIGVASRKKVSNFDTLVLKEKNYYSQQKKNDDVSAALNPNHTHFILVDSEKAVWGEEIVMRTLFEDYISTKWGVHIVLVVVNGGPGTLQTVAEGIQRNFPVIVVEGSGRASDAIAARVRAVTNPKYDLEPWFSLIKGQKPEMQTKLNTWMDIILAGVKQITLFNPNEDASSNMDVAILKALLSGSKDVSSFADKLYLGVEWGRPDIIRDLLERTSDQESGELKMEALNNALQMALEMDNPEIFTLIVEKGGEKGKVKLQKLYQLESVRYLFDRLVPIVGVNRKRSPVDGASEMEPLDEEKSKRSSTRLSYSFLSQNMLEIGQKALGAINPMYVKLLNDNRVTFADLLVWAILVDRHDMARAVWKQTVLPVHSALVGAHMYRALAVWFPGEDIYDDNANWFEEQAVRVLNEMEYDDAKKVLDYEWKELENRNALQIAELGDCKDFVSQQSVQRYLDEILYSNEYGRLPIGYGIWGIFMLVIFPFLAGGLYQPEKPGGRTHYMYSLPVVKFITSTSIYMVFLSLLSYLVVAIGGEDGKDIQFYNAEFVMWFWVAASLAEEVTQFLEDPESYFGRISNQMDAVIYFFLVSHIILRVVAFGTENELLFEVSVYVLIVATIMAYLRLLNVFAFSHSLGPLFFVITRLIKDVVKWVFIYAVFMISFQLGIMALTKQAGEHPWEPYPTGTFAVAFFTIIGDYSYAMETMDQTYIGVALLAIYALVAQIMLVNLLIAMMGDTYGDVKDNSVEEWRFYRSILVMDYCSTSAYPPPLNFILGPFFFIIRKFTQTAAPKNYSQLDKGETYQNASETQANAGHADMESLKKKMKFARDKILEDDETAESVSMESISLSIKESLRLMRNQRDSDHVFLQAQLRDINAAIADLKAQLTRPAGSPGPSGHAQ